MERNLLKILFYYFCVILSLEPLKYFKGLVWGSFNYQGYNIVNQNNSCIFAA